MFLQWLTWSNNCEPLNSAVCKYIGLGFKCLPKNNNKSINHRELRPFKKLSNCSMRKPFSQGETSFHIFKTDKARFYHSDFIVGFTVFEEQELNKATGHHASERESSSLTCGKKDSSLVNLKPLGARLFRHTFSKVFMYRSKTLHFPSSYSQHCSASVLAL